MTSLRALRTIACAGLCAALSAGSVFSQPLSATRVDDTGTVVSAPLVTMRWRDPVPRRGASDEVDGSVDIALRLNLAPWMNRETRLYLVLERPQVPGLTVVARWQTGGRLLPGTVRSGERALVFQGRITEPALREHLRFTLSAQGGRLSETQALQFHIEAELK